MRLILNIKNNFLDMEQFDANSIAWSGDWSKGERPEGYVSTTQLYSNLKRAGFSMGNALRIRLGQDEGAEALKTHGEIIAKAIAGEPLTKSEVESLLCINKEMMEAMKTFEENQTIMKGPVNDEKPILSSDISIKLERDIQSANDWNKLYESLDTAGKIIGLYERDSESVKRDINKIRAEISEWPTEFVDGLNIKTPALALVTRSLGLRQKVIDLLQLERKETDERLAQEILAGKVSADMPAKILRILDEARG